MTVREVFGVAGVDLFPRCFAITNRLEGGDRADGGLVTEATAARIHDPGGATAYGMSRRALVSVDVDKDGRMDFDLDGDGDVDEADLRLLIQMKHAGDPRADHLIESFYRDGYWRKVHADFMPWPWCLLAYDAAVNHGPGAAAVLIQRAVHVKDDGIVGPATLAAIRTTHTVEGLVEFVAQRDFLFARIYAHDTAKPTLGWLRRSARVHQIAATEAA